MARGRSTRRRRPGLVWRYWGLLVVAAIVGGLVTSTIAVLPYAVMTGLVLVWTLFSAPLSCGAINRRRGQVVEYCRNNSSGWLFGCWIKQHKYQRFTSAWWQQGWRDRTRGIWVNAPAKLATVTSVAGIVLGVVGIMIDLFDSR